MSRQTIWVVLVLLVTSALVVGGRAARSRLGELERLVVTELGTHGLVVSVAPRLGVTMTGAVRLSALEGKWRASWGTARFLLKEVLLGTRGPGTPILGAAVDELHIGGGHLTITLHDGYRESETLETSAAVERPSARDETETPPNDAPEEADTSVIADTQSSLGFTMDDSTLRVIGADGENVLAVGLELELDRLAWGRSADNRFGLSWDRGRYRVHDVQVAEREWLHSFVGDIRLDPERGRVELTREGDPQGGTPSVMVGFATEGGEVLYDLTFENSPFDVGAWLGAEPTGDDAQRADDGPAFSLLRGPSEMDLNAGGADAPASGRFGDGSIRFSGSGTAPYVTDLNGAGTVNVATGTMGATPLSHAMESRVVSLSLIGSPYETVEVEFAIDDGLVTIRPFAVMVGGGSICVEGTLELTSGELNLATRLRFARDLFSATGRTGTALTALTDADGVTVVPLQVQGTWADPELEIGIESDEFAALLEASDEERRSRLVFGTFPSCPDA